MEKSNPIIRLEKADIYQQETMILNEVDLELFPSEFVYMIGRTGSGKSSLLRTLYGDLPLVTGEAEIAGFNLKELKKKDVPFLRRKLGIIFQDFQLLTDRSVSSNLKFVLHATNWKNPDLIHRRVEEVLNQVGLKSKSDKMPYELSGGEQQRVAIARSLLNDPKIILADEPTGNLDPDTAAEILGLLYEIKKGGSLVFMATHNYKIIEKFPGRIIKVEDGKCFDNHQKSY
jgi:cell division transport system ATP-binding protein